MIRVFYGSAEYDKDRFLFDSIAMRMPRDIILIVPDQFTLQAERNAFEYMNTDTLLELEIMSNSSFSRRILASQGSPSEIPVNKYGRYMLLTKLMLEEKRTSGIFAGVNRKHSFITLLKELIGEMKQYGVRPEDLENIAEEFSSSDILHSKLIDIADIFAKYEKGMSGKYIDYEDLQSAVTEKIYQSERVAESEFWIDGFDYLTPKMLAMIEAIACTAKDINIVLTGGDSEEGVFAISNRMRSFIREIAARNGIDYKESAISEKYFSPANPEVSIIEAGDFYSEAETAAVEITKLVREQGFRYRDIVIICNDADRRGSVFRRVFGTYGIPIFIDRKRKITQEPAVEFIFSMLDVIRNGRRFNDVFSMIKTGYSPLSDSECEELENYCRKYNIKSGRWKRDFIYGQNDEGEERLARINDCRRRIDEFITEGENLFKGKKTIKAKTEAIYRFLSDTADMPNITSRTVQELESWDMFEYAESAAQVWKEIINIFDQIVEVIGDEEISDEDFSEILREGFEEIEIGLLPPNNDQVIFGTMQRTRTGSVRAMFVAGANEGVLPENGRTEGILSDEEKRLLADKRYIISKTDELRETEQNLAIYKNINKAREFLFISYSDIDPEGTALRPSELVGYIKERYHDVEERKDCINSAEIMDLMQTRQSVLPHLTQALRKYRNGENFTDEWRAAAILLKGDRSFEIAKKGLFYSNKIDRIERKTVKELYGRGISKELILSASRLERFSRCPFSFLITYGLNPSEERNFEVDLRSIGDIYHECLRNTSEALTDEGVEITAPQSRWLTVSEEECRELTDGYVNNFAESYREGIFNLPGRGIYIRERIKEICFQSAWLMISQVRSGHIRAVYFEQRFGRRADAIFPSIKLSTADGDNVYIEGIIDRVDIISGGDRGSNDDSDMEGNDFIRIIDYKSGSEKFDIDEVRSGWRLQLMIYLKGAMGGIKSVRPAGVFYFSVGEKNVDVTGKSIEQTAEAVLEGIIKKSRLDGILIDNEKAITGMDFSFDSSSAVIPVRRKKDGSYSGKSVISEEEFSELMDQTDINLKNQAAFLAGGHADIEPMSGKNTDACRYCGFRSICNYEK